MGFFEWTADSPILYIIMLSALGGFVGVITWELVGSFKREMAKDYDTETQD